MARSIYKEGSVEISLDRVDEHEVKVLVNGQTLIYIARETQEDFTFELTELLNSHRI